MASVSRVGGDAGRSEIAGEPDTDTDVDTYSVTQSFSRHDANAEA